MVQVDTYILLVEEILPKFREEVSDSCGLQIPDDWGWMVQINVTNGLILPDLPDRIRTPKFRCFFELEAPHYSLVTVL